MLTAIGNVTSREGKFKEANVDFRGAGKGDPGEGIHLRKGRFKGGGREYTSYRSTPKTSRLNAALSAQDQWLRRGRLIPREWERRGRVC